jgi:subtilase family serine protease
MAFIHLAMSPSKFLNRPSFYSAVFLAAATSIFADSVPVGGTRRAGHARPPIYINVTPATSTSYNPAQIRHGYGFDQLAATGAGQKIAIVDAYGNASIQSDMDTFCAQFGLPATTVQILGTNPGTDTGWALETALDVEWAHAIAPGATIILSVARSSGINDLLSAVDAAVSAGATVVSMSWGAAEFSGVSTYDSHFNKAGVTFTASSGDNGAGLEWPAVSPYVVSVGGTTLTLDSNNDRVSETAWSGSGGGISSYVAIPSYQSGWQSNAGRGVPDVSYLADPNTGVLVYDSVNGGWFVVGGTSAGAPQWAAAIALANQLRLASGASAIGAANPSIYSKAKGSTTTPYSVSPTYFYDVSSGNNGTYTAAPPYDFVTGVGSLVANTLLPALVPQAASPDFSLSASPSSVGVSAGGSTSSTISVTALGGFAGTVSLSATGLPSGATASFSPSSVAGSGTSTLTVAASASTPSGTYTVTITGQSGTVGHTTTLSLTVQAATAPDFSLSISPGSANVRAGNRASYNVTVSPTGGFGGTVSFTASGLPAGATASFLPASVPTSGSTTLTIATTSSAPRGNYSFTITGTGGSRTHSISASLKVR